MLQSNTLLRLLGFFILTLLPCLTFAQTENCTNGLDDDGDGQIDCYDSDCTCTGPCANFYFQTCAPVCSYHPPCDSIQLGIEWTGEADVGNYGVYVAGDLDKDGYPEVVTYRCESPDVYIADGRTGKTKVHIVSQTNYPGGTSPAIADLDGDGYGEIILVGEDRYIRCWNHDGSLLYKSFSKAGYDNGYRFSSPSIADFNHDGNPEICIGNQVYSGLFGFQLASGGSGRSSGQHPARQAGGYAFASSVPMQVFPKNYCPDCGNLQIVAGNQVVSVNLITGNETVLKQAPAGYSDGFTSVADFDRDGDLDAIVQGKKGTQNTIYVWDLTTGQVIREFQLLNNSSDGASRVNVADLDGDGQLEVSFIEYPWLYALDNDFSLMWKNYTDDVSSITGSSIFDFCGDGSADVLYRGSSHLQIIEGATGKVKWQDDCSSATHIEYPLVLDVDNDGQTEVIIACSTIGFPNNGHLTCYEAIGSPGIASRKVWNQHGYFNTNINDDLSVPRYQQNPNLVGNGLILNTFQNQYFNPTFPAPDGVLTLQNVTCLGDSLRLDLQVCNPGSNVLPGDTPISFYQKNPTSAATATWLSTRTVGTDLKPNDCKSITWKLPRIVADSFFAVLNDDHSLAPPFNLKKDFPVTTQGECVFTNNLVGLKFNFNSDQLALGPDTVLCGGANLQLSALAPDFVAWQWSNGSTLASQLVTVGGTFTVTVTDRCGQTQSDEIQVVKNPNTVVQLGPDRQICRGQTLNFSQTGFDFYQWSPSTAVNCPSCGTVTATPDQSGFLVLEASFATGCRSLDSIFVAVRDTFFQKIDTTVCYGLTVKWLGQDIAPGQTRTFPLKTQFGCDSTVQVKVRGTSLGTYFFKIDTAVCRGKFLPWGNVQLAPDSSHTFFLAAKTGCDSTVQVKAAAKDTFSTKENLRICGGETAQIFGQTVGQSGVFKKVFPAKNGCDSTHTVALEVLPLLSFSIDGTPTCAGKSDGSASINPLGGSPPFQFVWSIPNATGPSVQNLPTGNYFVTVTDAADCSRTASVGVPEWPPLEFSVETDSVHCWGEASGEIRVATPDSSLVFSLDGQAFGQNLVFEKLTAGNYSVEAEDTHGCRDARPTEVGQPLPLTLAFSPDVIIQLGDSALLRLYRSDDRPLIFSWNTTASLSCDTCRTFFSNPWQSTLYRLTVTDKEGCTASDEVLVEVERLVKIFVPNVFSPSAADDQNARLLPLCGPAIGQIRAFRVFDRWGDLLHERLNLAPGDLAAAWDGRDSGGRVAVAPGVYVWMLEIELVDGTVQRFQGDVSVLR